MILDEIRKEEIADISRENGYPGYTQLQCVKMVARALDSYPGPFVILGGATDSREVELEPIRGRDIIAMTKLALTGSGEPRLSLIFQSPSGLFAINSNVVLKAAGLLEERTDDFTEPWVRS